MAIVFQKVWRKGEFATQNEIMQVPNPHNHFVGEDEYYAEGKEFVKNEYGFTDKQMDDFKSCIEAGADVTYMATQSFKVVVETLDESK